MRIGVAAFAFCLILAQPVMGQATSNAITSSQIQNPIPCVNLDEHEGTLPEYQMKGCRSFNELEAAGGIEITKAQGFKSYACFATTFPEEASDLFLFVEISGVIKIGGDDTHNGFAKMATYYDGVKLNDSFAEMIWTQYPKNDPFLWSDGEWLGTGESGPASETDIKSAGLPYLSVSVQSDSVRMTLDLNNSKDTKETLEFNRRTGRGMVETGADLRSLRCIDLN